MILKFPAHDILTGAQLRTGTNVVGVKIGGQWDFTAEPITTAEFRKLRTAMLLSHGEDNGQMDHEDYELLRIYGLRYPEVWLDTLHAFQE